MLEEGSAACCNNLWDVRHRAAVGEGKKLTLNLRREKRICMSQVKKGHELKLAISLG